MNHFLSSRAAGFTVLELMISISIIGIILALAMSSFDDLIKRHQANEAVHDMAAIIAYVRSEAIKKSQVVTLCKSADELSCGGDWSDGWLIFVDNNKDGSRSLDEELIRTGHAAQNYVLSYSAFGYTLSQNGTFKLCPASRNNRYARAVIISKTARTRMAKDADHNGIYEAANGQPLNCAP